MQGWSPDFIPALARDARAAHLIDGYVPVAGNDALRCARELAAREGILCGITGGATFAAALEVARTAPAGSSILAMLPDTGERYLSTPLFAKIAEGMAAREQEIAASTPGFRFGAAPAKPAAPLAPPTPEAVAHVAGIVSDPKQPVVMFALEWCEFCWSVRKLFAAAGIEYRSVDLDSAAYRDGDLAGKVRAALAATTGAITIPQIFVGGTHIGGATDTFDAFNDGTLGAQLAQVGRSMEPAAVKDAYAFLPGWLHPR